MKRIKPLIPEPVVTPQCCVKFDEGNFAKHYLERRRDQCLTRGWDSARCCKPSSYEINGNFYCTQHAGKLALKMMTEEKP